jgi:hypothetical protein
MDPIEQRIKTSPKDFFLYVATMFALYTSVWAIIALLFEYINVLFPDALNGYRDPYSGAIRFAIASLVIIFPLYIYLTRTVNEDLRAHPEKRSMGIRKWLIYFTLFIGGVGIVGDLVVLVNTFLGGELTVRFLLKVLAVLIVVGGVFLYYLNDLRGKWEVKERASIIVGAVASLLVLIAIVAGFPIMGSPFTQREYRFDEEKVRDLQTIQYEIINYWQTKETLPQNLETLESDSIRGFIVPVDSQTKKPFEYRTTGATAFELCAEFNRESRATDTGGISYPTPAYYPEKGYDGANDVWSHEKGRQCFSRTIDPDRYPPYNKGE